MPNEQLIDTVISPAAGEQVEQLTKLLSELDIQFANGIKTVNQFNLATLNSKSFAEYNKNAIQAATGLEKLQQVQNQTAISTLKLDQAKQVAADKDAARLAKQQQAQATAQAQQDAADAKQIAAAEKKAARLRLLNDESGFPVAQQTSNSVTHDPSAANGEVIATPYQPIITGQEDMSSQTQARAAETTAIEQQQAALALLSAEYKQNLELQIALKDEMAINATELKSLNTETAIGAERQIYLTSEQIRLKVELANVSTELNRQTKEMIAAGGSITELDAKVLLLATAYEQLSVAERASEQGQKMGAELALLRTQQNELGLAVKNTKNNIGNYTDSINKSSAGMALADRVSNQFIRSIVRMGVQFLLIGVIFKAVEWIYQYVAALNAFNPVATETEMRQKALVEAFASSDYSKAIENIETLASDFDLVKKGLVGSDTAINKYNETLGKMFGYQKDVNDAQKAFIEHKKEYIQAIIDEAAAQAIAVDSAKQIADLAKKNQEMQNYNQQYGNLDDPKVYNAQVKTAGAEFVNLTRQQIRENIIEIAENKKRMDEIIANSITAMDNIQTGKRPNTTESDPVADLRTKLLNDQLEREKIIAQAKMNNDKLSYAERLQATKDFYAASEQIENNNEKNQIDKLPKNDARIEGFEKDHSNKLLQLTEQRHAAINALNDKQYKQQQENIKQSLENERDIFKGILDDPNQSYEAKLSALKFYNDRSKALIETSFNEQKTESGKNEESLLHAKLEYDKASKELDINTANERLKILKDEYTKVTEATKQGEQEQLETLDNGAKQALRNLESARDKQIDLVSEQRDKGKISAKKYNQEILDINDQFNIDKIAQELATQQAILAIQEGERDKTALTLKLEGISPDDIAKFVSGADKAIQGTKDKIADAGIALGKAIATKKKDDTKGGNVDEKDIVDAAQKAITDGIDEVDKLRQKAYEKELVRLEKLGEQIDENANNEKLRVNDSIASSATKAREIALIDKQAASAKKALQVEENNIKNKQAIADKEGAIAKIITNGAASIVKAFLEGGPVLEAIQIAAVAFELATAIATPLPRYALGTDNYPGGLGIWGEAGMERATLPGGEIRYSRGTEIANFPKGTKITPHMELMQLIRPEPVKFVGGEQIGWEQVLKQLRKMEPKSQRQRVNVNVDFGFENYKRSYLRR